MKTGEAAKLVGVSGATLRSWEHRFGPLAARSPGDRRNWDREFCLGLRRGLREGLSAGSAIERARELVGTGVLRDPMPLTQRMDRLEEAVRALTAAVQQLTPWTVPFDSRS